MLVAPRYATDKWSSANVCRFSVCEVLSGRAQIVSTVEALSKDRASTCKGMFLLDKNTFVFLSDEYFKDFPDKNLMRNKENIGGQLHGRPCFFAFSLPQNEDIFWVVPFTSKVEKFHVHYEKKIAKFRKCDTIVFGEVLGHEKAFLIQNMCPVTEKYIGSVYVDIQTRLPVRIAQPLAHEIESKARSVLEKQRRGIPLIFPDILKIEAQLLSHQRELLKEKPNIEAEHTPYNDLLVEITHREAKVHNAKDHDPER